VQNWGIAEAATNYDPMATVDDGSCAFASVATVLLAFLASDNDSGLVVTWLAGMDPCAGWPGSF
jgi:hypothetical protein